MNFKLNLSKRNLKSKWIDYLIVSVILVIVFIFCFYFQGFVGYKVISYLLLFVVSILAFVYGTGPVLLAASISAIAWNFLFIPPHFTLHIDNTEDVLMFVMFFIIAILNGVLTSQVRNREMQLRIRESRAHALYQITKDLSASSQPDKLKSLVVQAIKKEFNLDVCPVFKSDLEMLDKIIFDDVFKNDLDKHLIQSVFDNKSGTSKQIIHGHFTYIPLVGNKVVNGLLVVNRLNQLPSDEIDYWNTYLEQISVKLERENLREIASSAFLLKESDKLYKTLFNSISHEFRIPVTTIMGASDTLLTEVYDVEVQHNLLKEIYIASERLNQLIENLLNMSRLETGRLTIRSGWYDVHDLIKKVSKSLAGELKPFRFSVAVESEIFMAKFDFGLMEQVLHNLLLNATQHAIRGSSIDVKFFQNQDKMTIQIANDGSSLKENEESLVFEKFYRGDKNKTGNMGLGLSIVKGFVEAHKGVVYAKNKQNGEGVIFTIELPSEKSNFTNLPNK